jgi:hypothetical protein
MQSNTAVVQCVVLARRVCGQSQACQNGEALAMVLHIFADVLSQIYCFGMAWLRPSVLWQEARLALLGVHIHTDIFGHLLPGGKCGLATGRACTDGYACMLSRR